MPTTTAIFINYDGPNDATIRDRIGIQAGQGAKAAAISGVGMTNFIKELMVPTSAGVAAITAVPDLSGAPGDHGQFAGGMPGGASSSVLLTVVTDMTLTSLNDVFGVEVGGGTQAKSADWTGKVLNFVQNIGNGISGQVIISQGLFAHHADQWTIDAG